MHDKILPIVLLGICCTAESAQIYQCSAGDGAVSYQDTPCGVSAQAAMRVTQSSSQSGLRPAEKAWLKQLRKRPKARKKVPKRSTESSQQQGKTCWKKRQQLDEVRARLRRGYKPAQGEKLRRRRKAYEDYLFRYCD